MSLMLVKCEGANASAKAKREYEKAKKKYHQLLKKQETLLRGMFACLFFLSHSVLGICKDKSKKFKCMVPDLLSTLLWVFELR